MLIYILSGVFLGTIGLAWSHLLVHRYNLFWISICWEKHLSHHSDDTEEFNLKKDNNILVYSIKRLRIYLNPKNWKILDYLYLVSCCLNPYLIITYLIALYIACNIEYLQHDYQNYPIDFTNKFDNFIGFGFGNHTSHHGYMEVKNKIDTEFYIGLFAMYFWMLIVVLFYPILVISTKKSNGAGDYSYNLLQNIANYKELNGTSFSKLIHRMPSIFDKPKILIQYVKLMFGITNNNTEHPYFSHDISPIRNIYMKGAPYSVNDIVIKDGKILEGHHRYHAYMQEIIYES